MDSILYELEHILGPSSPSSSDERLFHCPFCHHRKRKLSVNFGKRHGMWKCWVCDQAGRKISTLLYRLGYSKKEIKQILQDYQYHEVKVEEDVERVLRLPPEYRPLWVPQDSYEYRNAIRYLSQRGVRPVEIWRYQMGYCESGKYKNRIIVPSYDRNNQLNYFTARAYYNTISYSYMNPAASKNVVLFENMINWSLPIVLVEGIFDAVAVRYNSIPLFGKVLSEKLKQRFIEERPPLTYIMLDSDASCEAHKIEYYIKNLGLDVKFVDMNSKDPADIGFERSWQLINSAKPSSFTELINSKL